MKKGSFWRRLRADWLWRRHKARWRNYHINKSTLQEWKEWIKEKDELAVTNPIRFAATSTFIIGSPPVGD